MKKLTTTTLLLGMLALRALSQEKPGEGDLDHLRQATERCVSALSRDRVTNTLQDLFKEYWGQPDKATAAATTLENQVEIGLKAFQLNAGNPISGEYEFLGTRRLAKSVVRFVYLRKYEHDVLLIRFEFYRALERWTLRGVQIGEQVNYDLDGLANGDQAPDAELDRCKEASEKCVSGLCQEQYTNAFAGLTMRYWSKQGEAEESAQALESQYDGVRRAYRLNHEKIIAGAYEYLGTRHLGRSLAQIAFVQKAEVSTVPLIFQFYRGPQGWKLTGVAIGSNSQDEIGAFWKDEPAR